jgi:acetyltransferase-like isoleucine patch superfamily enzyme
MKISSIFNEIDAWTTAFIINIPSVIFGYKIRSFYWGSKFKKIENGALFCKGSKFEAPELIVVGKEVIFGEKITVAANDSNGIYIGNQVAIAQGTYIRSANHNFDSLDLPIKQQGHNSAKIEYNNSIYSIVIEDDVWIAANAIILSGAFIGKGSIIGAGAVISNKIPEFSIVVGNPGRVVGNRKLNKNNNG